MINKNEYIRKTENELKYFGSDFNKYLNSLSKKWVLLILIQFNIKEVKNLTTNQIKTFTGKNVKNGVNLKSIFERNL